MAGNKRKSSDMLEESPRSEESSLSLSPTRKAAIENIQYSKTSMSAGEQNPEIIDLVSSSPPPQDADSRLPKLYDASSRDVEGNFYPSPYTSTSPSILNYDAAKAKKGLSRLPTLQPYKESQYTSVLEHELAIAKTKLAQANDKALRLRRENERLRQRLHNLSNTLYQPQPSRTQFQMSSNFQVPSHGQSQRILSLPEMSFLSHVDDPFTQQTQPGFHTFQSRQQPTTSCYQQRLPLIPLIPRTLQQFSSQHNQEIPLQFGFEARPQNHFHGAARRVPAATPRLVNVSFPQNRNAPNFYHRIRDLPDSDFEPNM